MLALTEPVETIEPLRTFEPQPASRVIELQQASKVYTSRKATTVTAVHDIALEISEGDFAVVIGRSGSGKTTLLNLMAGLTRPTAGRVLLGGLDLWSLPDAQRALLRNRKIGFIFQFPSLFPSLTVLENVMLPTALGATDKKDGARDRAADLLKMVGLTDKTHSYPRQLSAGQQQRVVIARSLINHPQILLADEPTSNLDEQTEREIMEIFREIHSSTGVTIVMVTHTSQLTSYGTRTLRMESGRLDPCAD